MKILKLKKFLSVVLAFILALGMTSCKYKDSVTTAGGVTIDVSKFGLNYVVSGLVVNHNKATVKDARISIFDGDLKIYVTTSNDAGVYEAKLNKGGTYRIEVEAKGYYKATDEVTFEENVRLVSKDLTLVPNGEPTGEESGVDKKEKDWITDDQMQVLRNPDGMIGQLKTNTLFAQNELGSISIELILGAVKVSDLVTMDGMPSENSSILMKALYSDNEAMTIVGGDIKNSNLADNEAWMCGVALVDSLPGTALVDKNSKITFHVDASLTQIVKAKKNVNGKWEEIPMEVNGNDIIITPTEFGVYALFTEVTYSDEVLVEEEAVRAYWENRSESTVQYLDYAEYRYNIGVGFNIVKGTNVAQALLLEYLGRTYGYTGVEIVGQYDMNKYPLRPGISLLFKGLQSNRKRNVFTKNVSVEMIKYGDIGFFVKEFTVDHEGGIF